MKIIKEGKLPNNDPEALYKGECGYCGCVVEAEYQEIEMVFGLTGLFVTCPFCTTGNIKMEEL